MSFSKRAFEELNNKGESMKEIDIKDANNLAKRLVNRIHNENSKLDIDPGLLRAMFIKFAPKLFIADPKTYHEYLEIDGELDLAKLVGDKDE